MKKVAHLVRDLATKTRGKVLVVGSYTAEQRLRSSYHAILQAAQSSGIPCVPFSPLIREEEEDSTPGCLIDHAVDGFAMARRTGCASVLVVGGGCTIEVAKSIATLLPSTINPQLLMEPSTRDKLISDVTGGTAVGTAAAAPMIAVPTTFHGCVAASSNRTYLSDPLEGAVMDMSSDHLDRAGGIHVVIEPSILRQSSPLTCAEGAISSLARLSDAVLINEGGADDIGKDGGRALGELLGSVKDLLNIFFDLHDRGQPSMASWTKLLEEEEDICEQYGAIGCVIGSCISLGGPGITQSIARVVTSNYNVSFGQACALVLPHVIKIQLERSSTYDASSMSARGAEVHRENVSFDGNQQGSNIYSAFGRIRNRVVIPTPSDDDLKELTSAVMMDNCFQNAVEEDNGKEDWTRATIANLLKATFAYLQEEE